MVFPDGLVKVSDWIGGCNNDNNALAHSGLLDKFAPLQMKAVGDALFPASNKHLVPLYKIKRLAAIAANSEDAEEGFSFLQNKSQVNRRGSSIRIPVEWTNRGFEEIAGNIFNWKKNKIDDGMTGKKLRVAALLYNLKVCVDGVNASKYFSVVPPSPEQFLRFVDNQNDVISIEREDIL